MSKRERDRGRYQRNAAKERMRARRKNWRKYGIDPADAEAALTTHGGACEVCGTTNPGGRGAWHVDHDHTTLRVRGILCLRCNAGIGQLGDNPDTLLKAAAYLMRRT